MYLVLTLYGSYLLYSDITNTSGSCSPSGAVGDEFAPKCGISAQMVFSSILGVAFAGQGAGQIGTWLEALGSAIEAIKPALEIIDKQSGIDTNLRSSVVAKVKKGFDGEEREKRKRIAEVPKIEVRLERRGG